MIVKNRRRTTPYLQRIRQPRYGLTRELRLKAITCVMAFLLPAYLLPVFLLPTHAAAKEQPVAKIVSHQVYFSLGDQFGAPTKDAKTRFDCSDKIYTVVELSNYPLGKHQISVLWLDPHNSTRENTEYPFNIRSDTTRLWAWLSLSRGTGAGMLQWIDPAAGLEDFIGPWSVKVLIDGKQIAKETFEVSC